ncbi:MAG: hypothetical protein ABFQ53_03675, partial [Patescibacteria group bacterium]
MNTLLKTDFSPEAKIDLDNLLHKGRDLNLVHSMIASSEKIDPYSYAYEVMQVSEVTYSHATGLAQGFLNNNSFDFLAFKAAWTVQKKLRIIEKIAQEHLNIDQLEQSPEIKKALMEAFEQG